MAAEIEDKVLSLSIKGYLFKQGARTGKKWQKRYVELVEGNVYYYESEEKTKLKGTIFLTEGWGIRSKNQCTCIWPPGVRPTRCFGLATKDRTYYFYSTDEAIDKWKENLQAVINVMGDPRDDPSNDHDGKPEGKKTKIAKAAAKVGAKAALSLGTQAALVAVEFADVDKSVKDLVKTGATAVNNTVEAAISASNDVKSTSKSANTGAKPVSSGTCHKSEMVNEDESVPVPSGACHKSEIVNEDESVPVLSGTCHKSEIVNENESEAHDMATGLAKGLESSAPKKAVINPPGVKDHQKKSEEVLERNEKIEIVIKIA